MTTHETQKIPTAPNIYTIPNEIFDSFKLGADRANGLLNSKDRALSLDGKHFSFIGQTIDAQVGIDEFTRTLVGMAVCLPSVIRFYRHNNKLGNDFENTILFKKYMGDFIEMLEAPFPLESLLNYLKQATDGKILTTDDNLLEIVQTSYAGTWHEKAIESALLRNNCNGLGGDVPDDANGVDYFIPGYTEGHLAQTDVKASLWEFPSPVTQITNDLVLSDLGKGDVSKKTPGFVVATNDDNDKILLSMTGLASPFAKARVTTGRSGTSIETPTVDCIVIRPLPNFGDKPGQISVARAVDNLRKYIDTLPQSALLRLNQQELARRFGGGVVGALFDKPVTINLK